MRYLNAFAPKLCLSILINPPSIMMAGAVTTATFLAGVTYYLANSPHATHRLQTELRTQFSSLDEINSKALMHCMYLNAVVEEGLRIYPLLGLVTYRELCRREDVRLMGCGFPRG